MGKSSIRSHAKFAMQLKQQEAPEKARLDAI
jgi:hypothetical protein